MSEFSFQPCERCRRAFEESARVRRQMVAAIAELERELRDLRGALACADERGAA
jgi:hypothetical protein